MAVRFLNADVSELCLGKPELVGIKETASISDALTALKKSGDTCLSVWGSGIDSVCVGKVSLTDVILFICEEEENLTDPLKAFVAPISRILSGGASVVAELESNSSVMDAIDCILDGAQNLVIQKQIHGSFSSRKRLISDGSRYCWLTQEDVLRYLLNYVSSFSPIPTFAIESLNVVEKDIMSLHYSEPASSALPYLNRALREQRSVAVVDEKNRLIGELSPLTLSCCDETVAAAVATLSVGELMAYIDYGDPPEDLVHLIKMRLEDRNLVGMLDLMDEFFPSLSSSSSSLCSSDDDLGLSRNSSSGRHYPARSSEAVFCSSSSSLVAVMIQALTHRVNSVWVVEKDHSLVGAVTLAGILNVFRDTAGQ